MITELTEEQKRQKAQYVKKYIDIGLNTDRIDQSNIQQTIDDFYVKILKRKTVPYKIFKSPYKNQNTSYQKESHKCKLTGFRD